MAATVAGIHGTIGEFNSTQEDWTSYVERLQQYFAANDVAEGKQKAVLTSKCLWSSYLPSHQKSFSSRESCRQIIYSASQTGTGSP